MQTTDPPKFVSYLKQIFPTTYGISREYWIAVAIAWVIAPIADWLIYTYIGRQQASEWTFSSIMTDKIPFTIFVFALTMFLIVVYSPYLVWRDNQKKIVALEAQINGSPALKMAYDPRSCLKIIGDRYLFSVEVFPVASTVPGVIVSVDKFDGIEHFEHIHRPFRFKYYPTNEHITCSIGEKTHVEILYFKKVEGGMLRLCFQRQEVSIPGIGPYNITLRATGVGASPDYKSFSIGIHDGNPFMEHVSS